MGNAAWAAGLSHLMLGRREEAHGWLVRAAETDFRLVECFEPGSSLCTMTPTCRLKQLLGSALQAYFATLDGATLADIAAAPPAGPSPPPRPAPQPDEADRAPAAPRRRIAITPAASAAARRRPR